MRRGLIVVVLFALSLPALAGCGDRDRDSIARLLSDGLTSRDPHVVCEGSLSPALLTRIYGSAQRCRETEREPAEQVSQAQSVEVRHVRVRGDRATAEVVIHGGNHDGARGTLTLRHEQLGWRVSDLSATLLRSQFDASLRRMQSIDASMKSCVMARMRALPDAEFKKLAYGADEAGRTRLAAVGRRCQEVIAAAGRLAV